jgi:hypothetical protein
VTVAVASGMTIGRTSSIVMTRSVRISSVSSVPAASHARRKSTMAKATTPKLMTMAVRMRACGSGSAISPGGADPADRHERRAAARQPAGREDEQIGRRG